MEILEIAMHHFGKFTGYTMKFHSGVNVIYGENETGKSTMGAFIRGMLFGIERMRGRGAKKDEYTVRRPWENGTFFEGSMGFESGGKVFRLDRSFDKNEKSASLVCETDGEELDIDHGDLLGLLDGMDEHIFDNTIYFSGLSGETTLDLAEGIRNYLINAGSTDGQQIDAMGALEDLKTQCKELEKEKKRQLAEKVERGQELSMKMDYARQEIDTLAEEEERLKRQLSLMTEDRDIDELDQFYREFDSAEDLTYGSRMWKMGKIIMAVMAAAAMIVGVLMTSWEKRAVAAVVVFAGCLGLILFNKKDAENKEELRKRRAQRREQALEKEYERQRQCRHQQEREIPKYQRVQMNLEWASSERRQKEDLLLKLQEEQRSFQEEDGDIRETEEKISAAYLAQDTLKELMDELSATCARKLNGRISEILSEITGGRYTGVSLNADFDVRIHTEQRVLSLWQVSRGTMEQVYFAVRMACTEIFEERERLPLILDDAFLTYDDTRLERTLRWLHTSGHQVILFTCHKREQEIMQKICS